MVEMTAVDPDGEIFATPPPTLLPMASAGPASGLAVVVEGFDMPIVSSVPWFSMKFVLELKVPVTRMPSEPAPVALIVPVFKISPDIAPAMSIATLPPEVALADTGVNSSEPPMLMLPYSTPGAVVVVPDTIVIPVEVPLPCTVTLPPETRLILPYIVPAMLTAVLALLLELDEVGVIASVPKISISLGWVELPSWAPEARLMP